MANFKNGFKLTNAGQVLELKAQTGKTLKFTKFSLGDGTYTGTIENITELVNKVMDTKITRLSVTTKATTKSVRIGFDLDTANIATGFYLREIGIYAQDPDTNEEILMYYGNAGDTADYIAPNTSGTTISSKLIDILLYISNADSISAVIDSSLVYATAKDIENLQSQVDTLDTKTTNYIKKIKTITLQPTDFTKIDDIYQAKITDENIKSGNYVDFNVSKDSYEVATEAEMQGYTICDEGYFILTCKEIPSADIIGNYTIIGGD